jgi:FtsH-binding integral membrane protein
MYFLKNHISGEDFMGELKTLAAVSVLTVSALTAEAADTAKCPLSVGYGVTLVLIYALIGALALFVCFKAFDKAITKIDLEEEIKKGNVAAAIFSAAIVIGIALIVAAAISG